MSLFGCRTCKARETEVAFLRDQVQQLQDKMLNVVDNHLQARLEASKHLPPRPDAQERKAGPPTSGAKRWQNVRHRADRPVPQTAEELEMQAKILEEEFRAVDA